MSTISQLMPDEFEYVGPIGVGTFGTVVKAKWKTKEKEVAIKRLPTLNPENREIQVLTSLRHKNIIQFFGLVCDKSGYGIVTELAENGSLYDFLRKKNKAKETLDYDRVIVWALDIARGMEYLHFHAPQTVIHRDLKSKNVVINGKHTCKLCDFGSSKFQQNSLREASTIAGTMAWMAPEVIKESLVIEASDTYSFAIVLWELLTCRVPYDCLENIQVAWLVAMKGERPHLPSEVPQKFKTLIQNCWKEDPKQRPNFQFLVKTLDNLKLDTDLQEKTAHFLDNPEKWLLDIGDKNDKLMKQSSELTDKEKQLQIWERQLNIKEKKLFQKEQRQQSNNTYQSLEKWSPKRVYDWVRDLRKGEGEELENQYNELACRFYAESVDGKALMLLGEEDLVKMKINGLGIRLDLLDYIKELRISNQNMMNFPPLAATLQNFSPQTIQNQSLKSLEIVLIFGSICRYNADIPRESKWKLYLELDGDEAAVPTVQSVEFVVNDKDWKFSLTRPPFIMNSWLVAEQLGMTECRVQFDDLIVVTPTDFTHLFTPDRGDDISEARLELKIKTHSKPGMTPQNSLPTSEFSAPPITTTSSSNQFDFTSGDMNRSGSTSTAEYKGAELIGPWTNPGNLVRMLTNQNHPTTIVKGGPLPSSSYSSSLHPSVRSQSSMSHISPRLSHASSSRASSPSNSIGLRSPNRPSSRTPVPHYGLPRSSTQSFTPTPISQVPRDKRHSLPAQHFHAPSPFNKPSFRYDTPSTASSQFDSLEKKGFFNGTSHSPEPLVQERRGQDQRWDTRSEDSFYRYSSDAGSVDERTSKREERIRSRPGSQQQRERNDRITNSNRNRPSEYRRDDTRDNKIEHGRDQSRDDIRDNKIEHGKDQSRDDIRDNKIEHGRDQRRDDIRDNKIEHGRDQRRDDIREYKRDDTREYKRDDTREYKRDDTRDNKMEFNRDQRREDTREYRRDDTRDQRRDDTRGYGREDRRDHRREDRRDSKKDDTLRRRDNTREQRGVPRNAGNRREDRANYRKDRDREPRKWEGRGDREPQHRRGSIPQLNSISNSHEVNNKPADNGNGSDSEWTVVGKNKTKAKSNFY